MRIGQRAFDRVVLARQRLAKLLERDLEGLDAAGIERLQRRLSLYELHRRALLRSGFGEPERAVLEFKRGEHDLRAQPQLLATRPPAEPAGDYQMDDEKEVGIERQYDPLANPPDAANGQPDDRLNRRDHGPQHEWALNIEPLQPVAHDGGGQRLGVDDDIRQLRHAS